MLSPERTGALSVAEVHSVISRCAVLHTIMLMRLLELQTRPPAGTDEETLLTVPEVSRQLKFRPAYVYELVRKGALAGIRSGKYVRIHKSSVDAWRRQHTLTRKGSTTI
jgi:excisionase family DNA binding protein